MSAERPSKDDIFNAAAEMIDAAERQAFLNEVCADDPQLRAEIEELLRQDLGAGSFLESPPAGLGVTIDKSISEQAGRRIGPYKLLQEIGEGGMGVVYLAEQVEPVERRVALKIIKPGMDTRQVIARFEAERQALAMMDHPNIAKVLDAGTTDAGQPYFVMELVKGTPITKYCDEKHLTPQQRLELTVPVCQGVQHAHQKGVIHRDIKPSNVLVAEYDDRPVPKIIDFGVAKAVDQRLTEKTMFTRHGQIVGTLEYMSPEQASLNQLDVDTRSDIYSLGVLLYELLTGETPFDRQRLRSAAFEELLRIIHDEEPPWPSLKLSSSHSLPSIAANRQIEPKKLSVLVRGELDWIVMKALEKDRARRYETASSLAADIKHYLNDEPVAAGPPSPAYRIRKFLRKHKRLIAVPAVIALLLIVGTTVSTWQAVRARRAEGHARQAEIQAKDDRDRAREAEAVAEAAQERAELEAAISLAANRFVQDDLLGQADLTMRGEAGWQPEADVTVRALLDRAADSVEARFSNQPLVEAAVRSTIGNAYRGLADYSRAKDHLQAALAIRQRELGPEHADTLQSVNDLAYLELQLGVGSQEATIARLTQALATSRRALGNDHPVTLTCLHNLTITGGTEAMLVECLEGRRRVLGLEHRDTLRTQHNLALYYHGRGQAERAEALYLRTLAACRRVLGPDHSLTLLCMSNLGGMYQQLEQFDQAEAMLVAALEGKRRIFGSAHPATLMSLKVLGHMYIERGQYDKAEPIAVEAMLAIERLPIAARRSTTVRSINLMSRLYQATWEIQLLEQKKYAEAELVLRRLSRISYGEAPQIQHQTESLLGAALAGQQKYSEAEPLLLAGYEGLKANEATLPAEQRHRPKEALQRIVDFYEAWGKSEIAQQWGAKLKEEQERQQHRRAAAKLIQQGKSLALSGDLEEAEKLLRRAVALDVDYYEVRLALADFLCYRKHDYEAAEAAYREVVRLVPEEWSSHAALSNALARQGNDAGAEAEFQEFHRINPGLHNAFAKNALAAAELADAREALRQNPESADAHCAVGLALLTAPGKRDEAESQFREALERNSNHADALTGIARLTYLHASRRDEARAALEKVLRSHPNHGPAHLYMGIMLKREEKKAEATAHFREAVRGIPEDPSAWSHLAAVLVPPRQALGKLNPAPRRQLAQAEAQLRAAVQNNPDDADARRLLSELHEFEAAERRLQEVVRQAPHDAAAHRELGQFLLQRFENEDAESEFRAALRLDAGDVAALVGLGDVLRRQQRFVEAEQAYRKAIDLHPDSLDARIGWASVLLALDPPKLELAEATYRDVLKTSPEHTDALSGIASVLEKLRLRDESAANPDRLRTFFAAIFVQRAEGLQRRKDTLADAEAYYRAALRQQQDYAPAQAGLAELLTARGDYDGAVDVYRAAIHLHADASLYVGLGRTMLLQNRAADAEPEFRAALELNADDAEAQYGLGATLSQQERFDEAAAAFHAATRLNRQYVAAFESLSNVLRRLGKEDEANQALSEARKLNRQQAEQSHYVGRLAVYRDASTREAGFHKLIRENPDSAGGRFSFGEFLASEGRYGEAEHEFREALRIQPNAANVHSALGSALGKQGKWKEAADAFADEVALSPQSAHAWSRRAGAHAHLGQWQQAVAFDAKATELSPDDPWRWYHLAVGHLGGGQWNEYRSVCATMLKRFGKTQDAKTAARVLYAALTLPDAVPDTAALLPLARLGADAWKGNNRILAAALYRAGRYEEALAEFKKCNTEDTNDGWESTLLAMTYCRLGRLDDARATLDAAFPGQAAEQINEGDAISVGAGSWYSSVEVKLLRSEAETLLREKLKQRNE